MREMSSIAEFTYDNVIQLKHLEELHLHIAQINAPVLAKCCKSNLSLRHLYLGYNSVQRNLSDIVPYCANLETLQFGMMAEPSAYKPLAKLPKLRQLIHFGVRRSGSFVPLLTDLAARRQQLQRLEIDGGTLSIEETLQIVRQSGLRQLKCFCSTAESVEMLSQLTQLQELSIWMSSRTEISAALLKVIGECKHLQLLCIASGNVSPDFIEDVTKLLFENRTEPNQTPLKLELPFTDCTSRNKELSQRNKVLSCSAFEIDSWKC
ncbi:uncharacterized protein LOC135433157 isoform X2 [Drosophila montana]|uniref:uncharacterized protein LOC135433157 isoform X2 n=1 Tax=Drosophila montana TaxID=40370 RepID=UPI00313AB142